MLCQIGASCYTTDIAEGKAFVWQDEIYIMVKYGEDRCQVRCVMSKGPHGLYFVSREIENFNSYAYVRPFSIV